MLSLNRKLGMTQNSSIFLWKSMPRDASGERAIVTLGRNVYPTIKKTSGLPPEIKTVLDLLVFEARGFELNHRGADVKPRKFIMKEDKHVIIQAPAPGYSQKLYDGVYLGILQMYGINNGKVIMTKGAPNLNMI